MQLTTVHGRLVLGQGEIGEHVNISRPIAWVPHQAATQARISGKEQVWSLVNTKVGQSQHHRDDNKMLEPFRQWWTYSRFSL